MKKLVFLLILIPLFSTAQPKLDSLWNIWIDKNEPDTIRLQALYDYGVKKFLYSNADSLQAIAQMQYDFAKEKASKLYMAKSIYVQGISKSLSGEHKEALIYFEKALPFFEELKDSAYIGKVVNSLGVNYKKLSNYNKAEEYYLLSEEIAKQVGDKNSELKAQNNLGNLHYEKGNLKKAIQYLTKVLTARELSGDEKSIASSLQSIGNVYFALTKYEEALDYYSRSLSLSVKLGNKRVTATNLNNMAQIYRIAMQDPAKALDLLQQSLAIRKELGDKNGVLTCILNIGVLYHRQEDYEEAHTYYADALELSRTMGVQYHEARLLRNMAEIYSAQGEKNKAKNYLNKSYNLSQKIGALDIIILSSEELYPIYLNEGNYKKAFDIYRTSVAARDSLHTTESREEVVRQEYKHQYEIQAAADSIKAAEAQKVTDAQLTAQKAQLKQEKTQRYALFGGSGLLLLFGVFMYNRFRITSKQKDVIEEQKGEVEKQKQIVDAAYDELGEKNREITDSIAYAKRIQSAILPPIKLVKSYLKDSFVLYKPKDVVSGDFYWMHPEANDGSTLFAAADCTGHGVPGAMVSVICNSALNRAVNEFDLSEPGEVLTKARELVIEEFEKSDEDVKDGMDIALCSLNGNTLKYAGAYNPLWIIRKDATEVEEIKAHKQAIGLVENDTPFPTHETKLEKGDTFYVFSDGFVDQFGGDNGKKFKSLNFRHLLLSHQDKSLAEQAQIINSTFENWRGDLEQIDDVCVIGVRV